MNVGKTTFKITSILLLLVVIATTGALCNNAGSMPENITLKYWRVFDEQDDFDEVIAAFQSQYPYVNIELRTLQYEEYEQELLDAWVRGEGPDIFSVPNDWMGKYKEYITPLPETVKVTTVSMQERLGKQEFYTDEQKLKTLSVQQLSNQFVDVVKSDVVFEDKEDKGVEKIYGLPLSVDTLALYYNKDLLNQSQIITPPKTWDEFVAGVVKATAINVNGEIVQAGAALGTNENIPRSMDIISLLMMQNGTKMAVGDSVDFTNTSEVQADYYPGVKAVEFYTSFAQEGKETYTWNEGMPDALEQFIQGNLAFFIGYQYHLAEIRQEAPNLNFDFTTVPQVNPTAKVNFAHYWVEAAASNTENPDMAWHFIEYLTQEAQAQKYLEKTMQPAALKNILSAQAEEYDLTPWVEQALTAQSWYHGKKPDVVEEAFRDMIIGVSTGLAETENVLRQAASKISLTYQ